MEQERKRKQSFLLRLPVSIREQATVTARNEGVSLNHFISLAVAEKISKFKPAPGIDHSSAMLHVSKSAVRSVPLHASAS